MAETKLTGLSKTSISLDHPTENRELHCDTTSDIDITSIVPTEEMRERSSYSNIRRYNSCPTKPMPAFDNPRSSLSANSAANDQDYDDLLHQEEERLRQERLQYYLRVLELERKKLDRLSRSRKYEQMKKANKFRITTTSTVSPV